jgi:hypothetical protein
MTRTLPLPAVVAFGLLRERALLKVVISLSRLMREIRQSIIDGRLDEYVKEFFRKQFPKGDYPEWARDALAVAGIDL